MRPDESEHDPFITGHSSNSISAAYGIYKAKKLKGEDGNAIAVIGDGALTGGMAYEALNNAGHGRSNFIVVLNDNKMSISNNVGSMSEHLKKIRLSRGYYKLKYRLEIFIRKIPFIGKSLFKVLSRIKQVFARQVYKNNLFESFGFKYIGPVDGHDVEQLETAFEIAKIQRKPCLVHTITVKGKGYSFAEEQPGNYHGVSAFDTHDGLAMSVGENFSTVCGKTLCKMAEQDKTVCAITAAMTTGTGLEEFSKSFGDKQVLDDVSLFVKKGEFVTILGPSGCGKTTLLRILAGFGTSDEGEIRIDGKDITNVPPHERPVNTVFQRYALFPHLNVYDNIAFGLKLKKVKEDEIELRVRKALKMVGMTDYEWRDVNSLSGGQQQRVAIARALVKMPRVLLLDEPLSNLDARLRLQTREEIRRIQRETGITTIFVTHDQEEAMSISDMIVVMKLGVLQQIGAPQDVYDDPKNLFVAKFLGTPPINVFEGTVSGGKLLLNGEAVLDVPGAADQDVFVGIRPEGFELDPNGPMHCALSSVEVMGRDSSVVSTHPSSVNPVVRSIINSDNKVDRNSETVSFSLKSHKVFLFNKENEERIYFEVK